MIETTVELRDAVDLLLNCTYGYSRYRFRVPQRPFREVVRTVGENGAVPRVETDSDEIASFLEG